MNLTPTLAAGLCEDIRPENRNCGKLVGRNVFKRLHIFNSIFTPLIENKIKEKQYFVFKKIKRLMGKTKFNCANYTKKADRAYSRSFRVKNSDKLHNVANKSE